MKKNKSKTKIICKITLLGILVFFSSTVLFSQNRVNLLFKPVIGLKYQTEISSTSTIIQEVMGIDQSMEMNIYMLLDSKVINETEGLFKIEYQYTSLKIASESPLFSIELNSDEDQDNDENKLVKTLTGKPFYVFINQYGEITDVTGLDQIIASVGENNNIDDETKELFRKNLEASFGREYFIQNMQQLFIVFPKKKSKIGEIWESNTFVKSSPAALNIRNKARLIDITKSSVLIKVNSEIETPDEGFKIIEGIPGKVELKGRQQMDVVIEKSSGFPLESIVNQDIDGLILFKLQEDKEEDLMEIPMSIKTNLQIKVSIKE